MTNDFCQRLRGRIPEIIGHWTASVDREPWNKLTPDERLDHLDEFLEALFNWTVCARLDDESAHPFLSAAAHHGIQRRGLGLGYDVVMEESALLRRAIWDCAHPFSDAVAAMVRIDAALSIGLMASLRGYARPELTEKGEWEGALGELAEEWASALART